MTPTELLFKLKNMPADTPITAEHIIAILGALQAPQTISDQPGAYSTWDNDKYIDTETLSEWIGEPVERLAKWRFDGIGPVFAKKPKHIAYRVGDVRDWLKSRTVQSTTQADKLSFVSAFDDCFVEPTIYHDDQPYSLFESIELYGKDEETNITGIEVFITKDPLATLYMQGNMDALFKENEINKVQTYFINGVENQGTVAHLVAQYPNENMQEWLPELLNLELDFEIKDSNGKSAIEYGEYNLNNYLNKRDLMLKFQAKFGNKN